MPGRSGARLQLFQDFPQGVACLRKFFLGEFAVFVRVKVDHFVTDIANTREFEVYLIGHRFWQTDFLELVQYMFGREDALVIRKGKLIQCLLLATIRGFERVIDIFLGRFCLLEDRADDILDFL